MSGMELFLMNNKMPASNITKAALLLAALGIGAIYGIIVSKQV